MASTWDDALYVPVCGQLREAGEAPAEEKQTYMRRRPGAGVVAASALVLALLPAAGATAAPAACGSSAATTLRTFHIVAKAQKKTYRLGDLVKVDVKVTRPAHEDPVDAGIALEPPVSMPAEDVNVSVGLYVGDHYLYGIGVTDAEGKDTISIKLSAPQAGWVRADVAARQFYNRGGCPDIEEEGYVSYPRFFKAIS